MKKVSKIKTRTAVVITFSLITVLSVVGAFIYWKLIQYPEGINEPLANQTSYVSVKFDPTKEFVFKQPTGTKIIIPANALIDSKGLAVKEEAELRFREFHNTKDIFLSGIPMQLGENRDSYFSSAGMFEIRTFRGDEELSLRKGSRLNVDLANFQDTMIGNYQLFELEDNTVWGGGSAFEVVRNVERDSILQAFNSKPPAPLSPISDSGKFIFEIVTNFKKMPHLRAWKAVEWELLSCVGDLTAKQAMRVDWQNIQIKQLNDDEFSIDFKTSLVKNSGTIVSYHTTLTAKPVLKGRKLEMALAKYEEDQKKYEKTLAKMEAEYNRAIQESALLNRFSTAGFGLFNCDRIIQTDIYATVSFEFDFEDEINPLINEIMLYMLLEDQNGVISYKSHEWDKLPLLNSSMTLAAVLPDGTVAIVSSEVLDKIIKNDSGKRYFKLETERIPYEEFSNSYQPKSSTTPKFV